MWTAALLEVIDIAAKKTKSAASVFLSLPFISSTENLKERCTSANNPSLFSKSYMALRALVSIRSAKKCLVVSSVAMPLGTRIPIKPSGATSRRESSAKSM